MACKISTAPINLTKGTYVACTEKCKLTYKYGLSNCSVTNKGTYLDIQCFSGLNIVKYGGATLTVSNVRLYLNSLNTYDGFHADAELIIQHSVGGGKSIYICIPVVNSEKASSSAKWFSKVIPYTPTAKNTGQEISVNNFTLDDVIPQSSFYVYDGGTFEWGCNATDEMVIFHKDQAINMKNREFRTLVSLLTRSSFNTQTPKADGMSFNAKGTSNGPGSSGGGSDGKTLTCTPIQDQDGLPLGQSLFDTLIPSSKGTGNVSDGQWLLKVLPYLGIIIGIIIGLLIVGFGFRYLFKYLGRSGGQGNAGNTSGA